MQIFGGVMGAAILAVTLGSIARADDVITLAPHVAVYDLKLQNPRQSSIRAVRGTFTYDFSGTACDGYDLKTSIVTAVDMPAGKVGPTEEIRSENWEAGDGAIFRFSIQKFANDKQTAETAGKAAHRQSVVEVDLLKPQMKTVNLTPDVLFPAQFLLRILTAARTGQPIPALTVLEGSENGVTTYRTRVAVGPPINNGQQQNEVDVHASMLSSMLRWPVTVNYFKKDGPTSDPPLYEVKSEIYNNGISRALLLDYNAFVLSGELTSLNIKDEKACH